MFKKILSSAVALCLVFGTAAVLPEGAVTGGTAITASAEEYGDYTYNVNSDGNVTVIRYNGKNSEVTIPSEIDGKKVTSISAYAFSNITGIKRVTIPDSVTNIYSCSFAGCTNLTDIDIPKSVTLIEGNVFNNTPWLDAQRRKDPLVIVNNILVDAKTCSGNVTIPSTVTRIAESAFRGCAELTGVTIPDTITSINYESFALCTKLTKVTIPNSVTSIDWYAFHGCTGLKDITIPSSVTSIGGNAFYGCTALTSINIPNSVTSIGNEAFYDCTALKSVTIPKSVASIGYDALGYYSYYDELTNRYKGKTKGFTLKCYSDSAAEKYAKENGIKYELLDQKAPAAKASIAKATVSSLKSRYYTGKAITQTPTVKLGTKTLKAGTDYTVSYKNNKAVGTATVTITGKGAYTGTVKATFKICPKKTDIKKVTSPKTNQLKVTYGKVSGVTGYQIAYSTNAKFTKKTTKSANSTATSKTIKKLTKGKTYYVKVRTYKTVGKTKYYSGYSAVKKIKVK